MLNVLFTTINFYMCSLYCFCFLSSRVVQFTACFMTLLALIFIVNWNFKLLNLHSILLCYYCLCCCCPLIIIMIIIYLLLLLFTHFFVYSFIFIILSVYLFCGLDLYKVQYFKSSPHKDILHFILNAFKICKMKYVNL